MRRADAFSGYHPAVNLLYFALVLGFSMFLTHPACLAASLVCAVAYAVMMDGRRALRAAVRRTLPLMVLTAVVNPLFNHEGATVLGYFPSGNALTLESVVYGAASAVMLAAVVTWFSCLSAVMTSDKLVYLFGRAAPALSLVLSMSLRFLPRFAAQARAVAEARRGLEPPRGRIARVREAAAVLSGVVTWSLENAIDTADSMKSRGYGLPGRTAFSIYRFDGRDRAAALWLGFCGLFLLSGALAGGFAWRYFPTIGGAAGGPIAVCLRIAYPALCLTPAAINLWEDFKWKRLRSGT